MLTYKVTEVKSMNTQSFLFIKIFTYFIIMRSKSEDQTKIHPEWL